MNDFLVFLGGFLRLFGLFGKRLSDITPIPWPLWIALLLPLYTAGLSLLIWSWRGRLWRVTCAYPVTTRGHPCRNRVPGEWSRCHLHRRTWRRSTDGHVVTTGLRRWQTLTRSGQVIERRDVMGRGLVRLNGQTSTLLFRRGYARPPTDVLRYLPTWWRESREQWRDVQARLHEIRMTPSSWRAVFWPVRTIEGVADRLSIVVPATRASIYAIALGLFVVVIAVISPSTVAEYVNYVAALCFVVTWAVLKEGVLQADAKWRSLAAKDVWNWAWPFLSFSVLGGLVVRYGSAYA